MAPRKPSSNKIPTPVQRAIDVHADRLDSASRATSQYAAQIAEALTFLGEYAPIEGPEGDDPILRIKNIYDLKSVEISPKQHGSFITASNALIRRGDKNTFMYSVPASQGGWRSQSGKGSLSCRLSQYVQYCDEFGVDIPERLQPLTNKLPEIDTAAALIGAGPDTHSRSK